MQIRLEGTHHTLMSILLEEDVVEAVIPVGVVGGVADEVVVVAVVEESVIPR